MNPALQNALKKVGGVIGASFLMALSGLLSKVLEPFLKWTMFTSMRILIKILPPGRLENMVISLYDELNKVYEEDSK